MKTIFSLIMATLFLSCRVWSQNPEWIVYNSSNSGLLDNDIRTLTIDNNMVKWIGTVNDATFSFDGSLWNHYNYLNSYVFDDYILCITADGQNNKWVGTRSYGLAKYDGTQWYLYDKTHSEIPDNKVYDIRFDGNLAWVATMHGLASFDGTNWIVYNSSNSAIPAEEIRAISLDGQGNKWIATWGGGIAKFDGTTWTAYNTSNSPIPSNYCISMYFDGTYFWIGTSGSGLVRFDGINWMVFTEANSDLPSNSVFSAIKEGTKLWFATAGGLALLEGTTWTVFTPSNSGLPGIYNKDIDIDPFGNKWIATDQGVAVYKQGGTVGTKELLHANSLNILVYPNPSKGSIEFSWQQPIKASVVLKITDCKGYILKIQEFENLVPGEYHKTIYPGELPTGVYLFQFILNGITPTRKIIFHE
jgi:ligand-binding sensor domain-containing protein